MRLSTSLLALTVAATHVAAATPKTIDDIIKGTPECVQTCLNDLYTDIVGDRCSKDAKTSSSDADLKCICSPTDDASKVNEEASKVSGCIVKGCGDSAKDVLAYKTAWEELDTLCGGKTNATASISISASTSTTTGMTTSTATNTTTGTSTESTADTTGTATTSSAAATGTDENSAVSMKETSFLAGVGVLVAAFFM